MRRGETIFVDHAAALGGAELYLLDVVRNYDRPCRVVLFESGPLVQELESAGVEVKVVGAPLAVRSVRKKSGALGSLLRAPAIVSFIRRLRREFAGADSVLLNSQKALIAGAPAAKLAGVPAVWNLHDILTSDHFGQLNRRVAVGVANRFLERVIANSNASRAALVESGFRGNKIDIVYNGIDAGRFTGVSSERRAELRDSLGVPTGSRVVGLFSRISEWKGQHVLIDAIAELDGVYALLVGSALFADDERYQNALHERIRDLGLGDRVIMAGFRSDIPALMGSCDVVAHTSTAPEPFGRVIVEAMLSGVPVVAANAGGVAEIIRHGENGLLSKPGDASELAGYLRQLTDPDMDSSAMVDEALRDAASRFSIHQMVSGVAESLERARNASST